MSSSRRAFEGRLARLVPEWLHVTVPVRVDTWAADSYRNIEPSSCRRYPMAVASSRDVSTDERKNGPSGAPEEEPAI